MTKKHFEAFAQLIAHTLPEQPYADDDLAYVDAIRTIARGMADIFRADNARFDPERFFRASGLLAVTPSKEETYKP